MSAETNAKPPTTSPDPALPPSTIEQKPSKTSNRPVEPEMAGANAASASKPTNALSLSSIPTDFKSLVNTTDSTLDRLNKLLKTPGGLASFLSTTNYALYILAHLHLTAPSRAQIIASLSRLLGRVGAPASATTVKSAAPAAAAATSPVLTLALTIADLRTTLRLIGLIPLYALLKSLLQDKDQNKDTALHLIKIGQALGYITFQAIENIYHLTNKGVINANWTNAKFARLGGMAMLPTWSCRGWCAGITFEFLRLFREAQLRRERERNALGVQATPEEKKKDDEKWWSEMMVATSWYPMALHYSIQGGVGLNLGMVGLCGFSANLGNFLRLWQGTQ